MLLLLLNYVVFRALWKIDVHLISTLVNKSLHYCYYYNTKQSMLIAITLQHDVSLSLMICVQQHACDILPDV